MYKKLIDALYEFISKYKYAEPTIALAEVIYKPPPSRETAHKMIEVIHDHLNRIRQERLRQANLSFNVAVVLTLFGAIVIFSGLILAYAGLLSAGIALSGIGGFLEVVSTVLFKFNKDTNDRLDDVMLDISSLEKVSVALQYVDQIPDELREKAILELSKHLNRKA